MKNNDFIKKIKIDDKMKYIYLQMKLKSGSIRISDLTNEELDNLIELYKKQIESKKIKLKNYKRKLINNN